MRLLLAEDEQELSKALTAILKHNHYEVDAVFNGQDALDYAMLSAYDGIILDIMMPKKAASKSCKRCGRRGTIRRFCC